MERSRTSFTQRGVFSAALGVTLALAMTGAATLAPAAQLDDKTCAQLKLEIGQLEGLGARDNMAKGAVWGKANLRSNQLEQVKKLIEMDETVQFRCPRPKPLPVAADPAKGKAPGKVIAKVLPKAAAPVKAGETAAVAPRPKARPKAPAATQAGDGAPQAVQKTQAAQPPASQPAAKPRPVQPKATNAAAPPAQ